MDRTGRERFVYPRWISHLVVMDGAKNGYMHLSIARRDGRDGYNVMDA